MIRAVEGDEGASIAVDGTRDRLYMINEPDSDYSISVCLFFFCALVFFF